MSDALRLSARFAVPAARVLADWLDADGHAAMTGAAATVEGDRFTAWEGYIEGRTVESGAGRIVQRWRTSEFPADAPDSLLEVIVRDVPGGCVVELVHTEIPAGQGPNYEQGWADYYFTPMTARYGARGGTMNQSEREVLAGLRILALTARADGTLDDAERAELGRALATIRAAGSFEGLPASVDELLAAEMSIEVEEEFLRTDEARASVYEAAMLVARADGREVPEELAILERLRPSDTEDTLIGQVLGEVADTVNPNAVRPVYDPERRATEVREDVLKYAILSGVLGAMPIPGLAVATDLGVVAVQVKMARDISRYWGHELGRDATKSLLGTISGSVVLRVALNNLARLVPGWGSVYGAATSFASTMAIGEVVNAYFEAGGAVSPEELRRRYAQEVEARRAEYERHKADVEALAAKREAEIAALGKALQAGEITREEYAEKVAELG